MKITRFIDVPRFTRDGHYEVDFPLSYFVKFIDEQINETGLELNPDFQRGNVWTEQQQVAYIEFFLRGGKTARVIYLNKPDWHLSVPKGSYNEFVCVDGLQRTTAIQKFINNEIRAFGSYYNEYTDSLRLGTDTIKVNVNDLKSKKEVLQWYLDFNTGGTVHTEQEIEKVKKLIEMED